MVCGSVVCSVQCVVMSMSLCCTNWLSWLIACKLTCKQVCLTVLNLCSLLPWELNRMMKERMNKWVSEWQKVRKTEWMNDWMHDWLTEWMKEWKVIDAFISMLKQVTSVCICLVFSSDPADANSECQSFRCIHRVRHICDADMYISEQRCKHELQIPKGLYRGSHRIDQQPHD